MLGIDNNEFRIQIRDLRENGLTPKQIARSLGVKSATIQPFIRELAAEKAENAPEPTVIRRLVNAGWSRGLTIRDDHEWTDDPIADRGTAGLVSILVARQDFRKRISVCGFLVDVYCLGLKNVLSPKKMNEEELSLFVRDYFASYYSEPLSIPLALAGELVHGAIAYARGLGFEPAKDFEAARQFLPAPNEDCPIEFGREGKPLFIQGPNDNPGRVMRTLEQTVGRDNFNFSVVAPAMHRPETV